MITPLDIQTQKFSSQAMGFKKQEVEEFLNTVLHDYEKLYKKSQESDAKIKELTNLLDGYKNMDETMKNTLVLAQSTAESLNQSAKSDAEAIINQAKIESGEIIKKATEKIQKLTEEFEALKKEVMMFAVKSKSEFQVQIQTLDKTIETLNSVEM